MSVVPRFVFSSALQTSNIGLCLFVYTYLTDKTELCTLCMEKIWVVCTVSNLQSCLSRSCALIRGGGGGVVNKYSMYISFPDKLFQSFSNVIKLVSFTS